MKIFFAGRQLPHLQTIGIIGIFSTKELADAACVEDLDFYYEFTLDHAQREEIHREPCYPRLEQSHA